MFITKHLRPRYLGQATFARAIKAATSKAEPRFQRANTPQQPDAEHPPMSDYRSRLMLID